MYSINDQRSVLLIIALLFEARASDAPVHRQQSRLLCVRTILSCALQRCIQNCATSVRSSLGGWGWEYLAMKSTPSLPTTIQPIFLANWPYHTLRGFPPSSSFVLLDCCFCLQYPPPPRHRLFSLYNLPFNLQVPLIFEAFHQPDCHLLP